MKDNSNNSIGLKLYTLVNNSRTKEAINLIEIKNLDINNFHYFPNGDSILINAVDCTGETRGSKQQIDLINYLLSKDVNVNWKNEYGYNALHISLHQHELSKISLYLIKTNRFNINESEDRNGNTLISIAIHGYGLTLKNELKIFNELRYQIILELLKRGANIDIVNKQGISTRKRLEKLPKNDRVHKLIEQYCESSI